MIDWFNLAANSLWILGCALALGAVSYASWQASVNHERLRARLGKPGAQIALNLAGVMFSAGLAATSGSTLEIVAWAILGVLFSFQTIVSVRKMRISP